MKHRPWSKICAASLLCLCAVFQRYPAEVPPEILTQLASDDFKTRESAEAQLKEWSSANRDAAVDELYRNAIEHSDAEVRLRCLSVLRGFVGEIYNTEGHGYVGILMQEDMVRVPGKDEAVAALLITAIVPDSPAAKAGIEVGDYIVSLNKEWWNQAPVSELFRNRVKSFKPFSEVTLQILRAGKLLDIQVRLSRRPAAAENAFQMPDQKQIEAMEKELREEHFRKWLLDRKKGR